MKHIKPYSLFESSTHKTWYHGTDQSFDKFEHRGQKGPSAFGVWFSDDEEFAKMFGEKVMTAELDIKNPYTISQDKWDSIREKHAKDTEWFKRWREELISKGHDALFIKERFSDFAGMKMRDPNIVGVLDLGIISGAKKLTESINEKIADANAAIIPFLKDKKFKNPKTKQFLYHGTDVNPSKFRLTDEYAGEDSDAWGADLPEGYLFLTTDIKEASAYGRFIIPCELEKYDHIFFKVNSDAPSQVFDDDYGISIISQTGVKYNQFGMWSHFEESGKNSLIIKGTGRWTVITGIDNIIPRTDLAEEFYGIDESVNEGADIYESIKVKEKKENEDRTELIAYDGKNRAGYMIIEHNVSAYWYFEDDFSEDEYLEMFPDDEFMKFEHIEVEDNYRGRGVAQELIKAAIERTKKMNIKRAYLNASPMGTHGLSIKPLVALYKKFGFEEILDQGDNVQMVLKLDKPLNENMDSYKHGGIVLIYGMPLEDGTRRLYAAHIKKVLQYDRFKKGDKYAKPTGKAARMVLLGDDTYRIVDDQGKLKAVKVLGGDQAIGAQGRRMVLNNQKTPYHWESTKHEFFPMMLRNMESVIRSIPDLIL